MPTPVLSPRLLDALVMPAGRNGAARFVPSRAKPRIIRYLEPDLWQEVKAFIESMPSENDQERAHYARLRRLAG